MRPIALAVAAFVLPLPLSSQSQIASGKLAGLLGMQIVAVATYCVVEDPSPTPLNLRTAPYGRIIGNVRNGTKVTILDNAVDASGKPWIYLAGDDGVPLGWAFKNYVKCF